jgi:hypothetical protein
MLEVLAHTDLSHQAVLVSVHARKLSYVGEGVLKTISELVGLYVTQTELNIQVRLSKYGWTINCTYLYLPIHQQLSQPQDLTAQMERITKTRLLSFLCRESFNWLKVKVVV